MQLSLHGRLLFALATVLLVAATTTQLCQGYNITRILERHPQFSTFNHYLSVTHLAEEINRRRTITVLAVDNAAMSPLLARHPTIFTIKNVLSFHVLADYFGSKRLHEINHRSALVASLFQATGAAPGTTGFVNITNVRGGHVAFGAEDNGGVLNARFVKSIKHLSYRISVVQISSLLHSPEAEAPAPAPAQYNITILMSKKGCKVFADLASTTGDVEKTFESYMDSGFTLFCPIDQAMNKFMPKYKKLTVGGKSSLLLYHGLSDYNSMQMLKTSSGKVGTLATVGKTKNYNFTFHDTGELVTIDTRINKVKVTGTVMDEQPLAIYTIDKVLEPNELFKVAEIAPAPKASAVLDSSSSDDEPSSDEADDTDTDVTNGTDGPLGGRWSVVVVVASSVLAGFVGF